MATTPRDLQQWMESQEDEHLEFKEAKNNFDFRELRKYCVALANEMGGKIVLGITNDKPRRVVGTQAFRSIDGTKMSLVQNLHLRVEIEELLVSGKRVLVIRVPARPLGYPMACDGAYWMRTGQSVVPMTPDRLKSIFAETGPDFSAEICRGATSADLDVNAVQRFRDLWKRKSRNATLETASQERLLADAELVLDGAVTCAALILFGTRPAVGRFLPQAELIFEYRSNEASIPYAQRQEYREGFFLWGDDLWNLINLRNEVQPYQDGLFKRDIPTFDETVVREAILNAVSHRDYRLGGSVFVRQFPRKLEVVSPGGFPPGITPQNILHRQSPRNRRLAEAFARCGLVERSGQGFDRMFERSIRQGKPLPDLSASDEYQVSVVLQGEVQDPRFLRFLEKVNEEKRRPFTTDDLIVLNSVYREQPIAGDLEQRVRDLANEGIIERVGSGRRTKYILSRRLYGFLGEKGTYTRKRGLDRETHKALLLKQIEDDKKDGSVLKDLAQVLPDKSRSQVQRMLRDLQSEGRIHPVGKTRGARWFPGPPPGDKAE